jgi:hypothetical protein
MATKQEALERARDFVLALYDSDKGSVVDISEHATVGRLVFDVAQWLHQYPQDDEANKD